MMTSLLLYAILILGEPVLVVSSGAAHAPLLGVALDCQRFDGWAVTVIGAASLEFEEHVICPTREFLEADSLHCLWIATDSFFSSAELAAVKDELERGDYVMIDGTVSCRNRGHLSMSAGALEEVRLIVRERDSEVLFEHRPPEIETSSAAGRTSPMANTPLLSIALDCEKHAGHDVTVTGAIAIEFEVQALCPTREFLDADPLHCLWLVADDHLSGEELEVLSKKVKRGQYVTIDGTVTCDEDRHGPLYGGGLEKISIAISHSDGAVIWRSRSGAERAGVGIRWGAPLR